MRENPMKMDDVVHFWLVVEPPSDKYEFVSWDDEIPTRWKNKTRSKPPTSYGFVVFSTDLQRFIDIPIDMANASETNLFLFLQRAISKNTYLPAHGPVPSLFNIMTRQVDLRVPAVPLSSGAEWQLVEKSWRNKRALVARRSTKRHVDM